MNLVNFMDRLDLMTVVEVVPVTSALGLPGWFGDLSTSAGLLATALCGAILGFAPFNRPAAKVFLGNVGSLPMGLLLGWCLLELAWHGQPAAALLLPAYYLADSTVTRFAASSGASRSGRHTVRTSINVQLTTVLPSRASSGEVFLLNLLLAALAIVTVRAGSMTITIVSLFAGAAAVAFVLRRFLALSRPEIPPPAAAPPRERPAAAGRSRSPSRCSARANGSGCHAYPAGPSR